MKYRIILLCCTLNMVWARPPLDQIITFFIYQAPFGGEQKDEQKLQQKVAVPGSLSSTIAKHYKKTTNQGIFASYSGFMRLSDALGQITFPRLTQKPLLYLLVTEKINPIMMLGNTIHHWERFPHLPYTFYSIERHRDPQTELFYWDVQEVAFPHNNVIPLNAITIFAKPKNILVPTGISLTSDSAQWVLPPLYSTKTLNDVMPALFVLNIKQFFGSLTTTNKKVSDTSDATLLNYQ